MLAGFDRRCAPVQHIADDARDVALACRAMAARFAAGGRLLVFGNGAGATDAEHIAVEFVHPVIVGKRALPAVSLASDVATVTGLAQRTGLDDVFAHQVRVLGRPDDIALGVCDVPAANVTAGLRAARKMGMLTIALLGGDAAAAADAEHVFITPSDDAAVIKEAHVTMYHLLWELVHVFFDAPGASAAHTGTAPDVNVQALYPSLYGSSSAESELVDAVAASTVDKVREVAELRHAVGVDQADRVAACAADLAGLLGAGGTLWAFGNGGSSTDAQDVVHTFLDPADGGRALAAQCLTSDAAIVTALSNDVGYDVVFARQLRAFGRPGDAAVGISTSGGSVNVLDGFAEAKAAGLMTIGLSGYGGGRMSEHPALDYLFSVPSSSVHRVQEVQTTIYHVLAEATRAAIARS